MKQDREGSFVPPPHVVERLSEYANLLARFGPNSPEAEAFYAANKELPTFTENADDLKRLEQEDWEIRSTIFPRSS